MEEQQQTVPVAARGRRPHVAVLVGAGLLAGVAMSWLGLAQAQSADPSPTPTASVAPDRPKPPRLGHRGGHGLKLGRGALHGEFTTKAPGGGYQTMAMQVGEVTAVSASSITVKSEDGWSRTYVVNDGTLVEAGDTGIGDVQAGDRVRVMAVVSGGRANAVSVVDATRVRELRGRWMPKPRA